MDIQYNLLFNVITYWYVLLLTWCIVETVVKIILVRLACLSSVKIGFRLLCVLLRQELPLIPGILLIII